MYESVNAAHSRYENLELFRKRPASIVFQIPVKKGGIDSSDR